ncbi:Triosephosphate isomerase protein [Rutstroemia sp. NJR-2017a BBW]|nr:Triosephosphate isomerase protein [Rutstroemia sp. NJR-2017a BBW]
MAQNPHKRTVGVSLKMYFDLEKTSKYISDCTALAPHALSRNVDIFLIPDFLSLTAASTILRFEAPTVKLGAQNCFWEDSGAYTGEVSPAVLRQIGCSLVELGHAERRRLFGETDEIVAKKARAVLRNGMIPLVCIGEKTRESVEMAVEECRGQVVSILEVLGKDEEVIFAYEPVWAIGQAEPAEASYVVDVVKGLRELCEGREVRFLYGGSAGPGTFEKMKDGVDGLFLGRFGHDVKNFREVIRASYAGLTVAHRQALERNLTQSPRYQGPPCLAFGTYRTALVPGQVEIDDLFAPIVPGFANYPESSFRFVKGMAVPAGLNRAAKTVRIKQDGSGHLIDEPYEFLVVATGTSAPAPDMPWKAGVWSYHDLKNMLQSYKDKISRASKIVIGGGGPTGVELAGELASANGHPNGLSSSEELLPRIGHSSASREAEYKLTTLGAKVHLGRPVSTFIEPDDDSEIRIFMTGEGFDRCTCNLYLPATGNSPNSCILQPELFEASTGLARVDDYLRIAGTEDIWAAGDISNAEPALCVNAVRQGLWVAKNLDRMLRNKEPKEYEFNKPSLVF